MTIIIKTGDYTLHAKVTPTSIGGLYQLRFFSELNTAKHPSEPRNVFSCTLEKSSLQILITEINNAIEATHVQNNA